MSAWTNILAASQLAMGTAWDLITHPKIGSGATVYIEQIQSTLIDTTVQSTVQDDTVQTTVAEDTITSSITITNATTALPDDTISVEVT